MKIKEDNVFKIMFKNVQRRQNWCRNECTNRDGKECRFRDTFNVVIFIIIVHVAVTKHE